MNRITIVSILISVMLLFFIVQQVRKKRLSEAYSLLWIFTGIIFTIIAAFPSFLGVISSLIGINYPPATLFLILIMGVVLILLQFSILLTIRSKQTKKIAQELAIIRNELEKLSRHI